MTELTLGQTVARDVLMVIAMLHGAMGGRRLTETAQTGDEREEVFGRIADAVDEKAMAIRHTLEGVMSDVVRRGILATPVNMAVDFRAVVIAELQTGGLTEDQATEIVNHLSRHERSD